MLSKAILFDGWLNTFDETPKEVSPYSFILDSKRNIHILVTILIIKVLFTLQAKNKGKHLPMV